MCRSKCKSYEDDAFYSTIFEYKRMTLETFLTRLKNGEPASELLNYYKSKLPELAEAEALESEHPSFYWYDEHHYYKVYSGEREACEEIIELLEKHIAAE